MCYSCTAQNSPTTILFCFVEGSKRGKDSYSVSHSGCYALLYLIYHVYSNTVDCSQDSSVKQANNTEGLKPACLSLIPIISKEWRFSERLCFRHDYIEVSLIVYLMQKVRNGFHKGPLWSFRVGALFLFFIFYH